MLYTDKHIQLDVQVLLRRWIADPQLRLYQYTVIDEYTLYRVLRTYEEQGPFRQQIL